MANARIMRGRIVAAFLRAGWRPPTLSDEAADRLIEDIGRVHPMATLELGKREHEILSLMADGLTRNEIAKQLDLSQETVKSYQKRVFRRLGARNGPHAIATAMRRGILM